MPGSQVKDWDLYHRLRAKGYSKEKAARIANAMARRVAKHYGPGPHPSGSSQAVHGGHSHPGWTFEPSPAARDTMEKAISFYDKRWPGGLLDRMPIVENANLLSEFSSKAAALKGVMYLDPSKLKDPRVIRSAMPYVYDDPIVGVFVHELAHVLGHRLPVEVWAEIEKVMPTYVGGGTDYGPRNEAWFFAPSHYALENTHEFFAEALAYAFHYPEESWQGVTPKIMEILDRHLADYEVKVQYEQHDRDEMIRVAGEEGVKAIERDFPDFFSRKETSPVLVAKHGTGDQTPHGNWADGITSEPDTSYRGGHQPSAEYGAPAYDLAVLVSDDIYTNPEWYFSMSESYNKLGARIMQRLRNDPDAPVTIYRAVPTDASNDINPGDWVTTVPSYAKLHGESSLNGQYKVVTRKVTAKELMWPGDSMVEFGWFPDNPFATGEAKTLEDLEKSVWFAKHYPGGKDHDQKNHGRRGSGLGSATLPEPWRSKGDAKFTELVRVEDIARWIEYDRAAKYPDRVAELAEQIAVNGFTDPIILEVRPISRDSMDIKMGKVLLVEGNHRYAAALKLGLTHIPAKVLIVDYPWPYQWDAPPGKEQPRTVDLKMTVRDAWFGSGFKRPSQLFELPDIRKRRQVAALIRKHPGSGGSATHDTGTGQEVHDPKTGGGGAERRVVRPSDVVPPKAMLGLKEAEQVILRSYPGMDVGGMTNAVLNSLYQRSPRFTLDGVQVSKRGDVLMFQRGNFGVALIRDNTRGVWQYPDGTDVISDLDAFIEDLAMEHNIVFEPPSAPFTVPDISDEQLGTILQTDETGKIALPAYEEDPTTSGADLKATDKAMFDFQGRDLTYERRTKEGQRNVARLMEEIGGDEIRQEYQELEDSFRQTLIDTYDTAWERATGVESDDGRAPDGSLTWRRIFEPKEIVGQTVLPGVQTELGVQVSRTYTENSVVEGVEGVPLLEVTGSTQYELDHIGDLYEIGTNSVFSYSPFGRGTSTPPSTMQDGMTALEMAIWDELGTADPAPKSLAGEGVVEDAVMDWSGRLGVDTTSDGEDILLDMVLRRGGSVTAEWGGEGQFLHDTVQHLRDRWASSSTHPESIAVQLAAEEVFGLKPDTEHWGDAYRDGEVLYERMPVLYDTYVRAVYANTQAGFAEMGITHVPVIRGMAMTPGRDFPAELLESMREAQGFVPHPLLGNAKAELVTNADGVQDLMPLASSHIVPREVMDNVWIEAARAELLGSPSLTYVVDNPGGSPDVYRFEPVTRPGLAASYKDYLDKGGIAQGVKSPNLFDFPTTPLSTSLWDGAAFDVYWSSPGAPVTGEKLVGTVVRTSILSPSGSPEWLYFRPDNTFGIKRDFMDLVSSGLPPTDAGDTWKLGEISGGYLLAGNELTTVLEASAAMRQVHSAQFGFVEKIQVPTWSTASIDLQPLSSFSTEIDQARKFENADSRGTHDALVRMLVPVERIWGHSLDGFGSLGEHEVIVIGERDLPAQFMAWSPDTESQARGAISEEVHKVLA